MKELTTRACRGAGAGGRDARDERERLRRAARRCIDAAIADPRLSPERIAALLHVSTRTLYRLFAGEPGTVGARIRHRRLELCRRDLSDPACDALPITRIATRWGLSGGAQFTRTFKSAYGVPPSRYRELMQLERVGRSAAADIGTQDTPSAGGIRNRRVIR